MAHSEELIDKIISTDGIGAGNYFFSLQSSLSEEEKERSYIELDVPVRGFPQTLSLSINRLNILSSIYANWFVSQGIGSKDTVAIFLDDGIDYFVLYLSLTRIGAIPIFINSDLSRDVVVPFLNYVDTVALVTDTVRLGDLEAILDSAEHGTDLLNINDVVFPGGDIDRLELPAPPVYRHDENDAVLLSHTSGTTGIPKAVRFTHASLFYGFRKQLKKQVGERVLSALPHSHGSSVGILMSVFLKGVHIRIQTDRRVNSLQSAVKDYKPEMVAAFPKTYVELCRGELDSASFNSVSYWLSTGDANHESHIRKLTALGHHKVGERIFEGSVFIDNLGSTEFAYAVFVNIHTRFSNNYGRCIGNPMEWADVAVLSDNAEELGDYEVGKLGVSSESVTPGYWNKSLLTEKSRLGKYWLLGDLVYRNSAGVYFHVDRIQDSINFNGTILYSCQVEELIMSSVASVFDCSLVVLDATESSEAQLLLVVDTNSVTQDESELREEVNEVLDKHNIPRVSKVVWEFVSENAGVTGKKLKRKLRQQYSAA